MDKAIEGADAVRRVKPGRKPMVAAVEMLAEASPSQAYAMRVWGGQSVDVPRAERIERCMNALRGQNLPTDGIEFPV